MSQTQITGWLWSQPRTVTTNRQELMVIQGLLVLTHHEKEQGLAGEGGSSGDREALFL